MTAAASPLGRYVVPTEPGDPTVEVHLLGTPLELLVRAREHHDGLLREFRLLALSGGLDPAAAPQRLVELTEVLGRRYGNAGTRSDTQVDEALDAGHERMDLLYVVPHSVVDAVRSLDELMVEADRFCAAEQLMTVERPKVLKDLGRWYLDQFAVQCAGGAPVPWDGPTTVPDD